MLGIGWQWALVGFVVWGVRKRSVGLAELIGGRWPNVKAVFLDLAGAVLFLFVSYVVLGLLAIALKPGKNAAISGLLPHGLTEILFYLGLALSAGVTEEIIFRGYLQKQLSAISNSVTFAVIVQGIVFGASHGYQGGKRMLIVGVFGCLFGALAVRRGSLRPGMIAHALHDGFLGVVWALIRHQ